MKKSKVIIAMTLAVVMSFATVQSAFACTILGVGKLATDDGSTIVTHNDDSSVADFRLWIIPSMEGGKDVTRDLVKDSHNYGDYGNFPEDKDYGSGYVVAELDQPEDTYAYLHSRYSFINEKGVATSESTFTYDRKSDAGLKAYNAIFDGNDGLIDCWNAQDIALERASTAREAIMIVAELVDEFGWGDAGESIFWCDGEEVWFSEWYGRDLWAAVRIPDDAYTVAANRARIDYVDFDDPDNYMCSENIISFAIENDLWDEADIDNFSPAEAYNPYDGVYSTRREWRALDLVAPSLELDPEDTRFPLWVIPEAELSVQDVFKITGDYYQGTEYDTSLAPQAGPFGDVVNNKAVERTINLWRSCYIMIANVKSDMPDEVKPLVWYGYGAADSTYLTPLWPTMNELPELYQIGNRYEPFDRNSGWWTNSYVQQVAGINYKSAIEDIHGWREDKMNTQYEVVPQLQKVAAELADAGLTQQAKDLLTTYAYNNAVEWHDSWLELGDFLLGKYMWGMVYMRNAAWPEWWQEIMNEAPRNPGN